MTNWWKSITCRHKWEKADSVYMPYNLFFPQCQIVEYRCVKCRITKIEYK